MVQLGGLEPPTSGSTIRRSNQLSYSCTCPTTSQLQARKSLGRRWCYFKQNFECNIHLFPQKGEFGGYVNCFSDPEPNGT